MRRDLLLMALAVGVATWGFRFLPTRLRLSEMREDGLLSRFLAATGPAAIAALCMASGLPMMRGGGEIVPLILGTAAVLAVFWWQRSVVAATLAGAAGFGGAVWVLGSVAG